ncbi:Protein kinase domain-containing protein [Mycena kentingensis (nom. inval.)]|nr:Protein kinase domain-containing protein [Mycena kentingensis (nom. inval.)]
MWRPLPSPSSSLLITNLANPQTPHAPLAFLTPLADAMTHRDPTLRPTMGEVVLRFDALCAGLSPTHLRRPGQAYSGAGEGWKGWVEQMARQVGNVVHGVPPLPRHAYYPAAEPYTETAMSSSLDIIFAKRFPDEKKNAAIEAIGAALTEAEKSAWRFAKIY